MEKSTRAVKINRDLRDLPRPLPSAGLDEYHRVLDKALATDQRRHENYDKFMQANRRKSLVDYLPIKLDIENVSRCNFKCTMCTVSDWEKGKRADDMSLDEFKKLIDEQYGLVEIKLQGIGEPTIQGDDYFNMIKYARAKGIWVRTTTNASLLHLHNNYRKLVDADPNEIQISIDAATKDVFESIRHGSVFEQVIENSKSINAYALEKNKRTTKMWSVIQTSNHHQLFDLLNLADELGFRDQTFAFSLANWGKEDWREKNDSISAEEQIDPEIAWQLVEKGESMGIRVSFWNSTDKYSIRSNETLCAWPFERAAITSDLRTVPCCTIGDPDAYEIGRGKGKSFSELWFSEEYQTFRQAHLSGNIPKVCQTCYYAEST